MSDPGNQVSARPAPNQQRKESLFALLVVGMAFAAMVALTWRKWGDILVDYGPQLYVPWQLASGAVLYRDVFYLPGGPVSQYYHALLFKVFGVSFLTLAVSSLVNQC